MIYPRSHLSRGLLVGTAVVMFATMIGSAAGATETQGQQTVSNHQKLEQAWTAEGHRIPTTATTNWLYTVQTGASPIWDSTLSLDGNRQSAEISGNAATSTLTANTVHADGGGSFDEPSPFAVLHNRQSGDNIVTATSRMTVAVPGEIGGSSVTLSNNANTALARINDAANIVTVETVGLSGDVLLNSGQSASGKVTAKTFSGVIAGNPDAAVQGDHLTVRDNGAGSEADGNRVLNSLKAEAATVMGGRPVLDNRQTNAAAINASTSASFTVKGSGAIQSAIGIDGNSASSLARGNVAENRMTVSGGMGNGDYPGGGDVPSLAAATVSPASAGAVLSNRQVNTGAVAAKTNVTAGVALNCGCTSDSRISFADNTSTALAYGNAALNAATVDGMPTALVSNAQVNRGPVSATVTGRFGAAMTGGVNASMVSVSGNSLAATAIGNQAVNLLNATGNLHAASAGVPR